MNSYKLNSIAGRMTRFTITKGLNIHFTEIYKVIKAIDNENIITLYDGRKFKLELKYLGNE